MLFILVFENHSLLNLLSRQLLVIVERHLFLDDLELPNLFLLSLDLRQVLLLLKLQLVVPFFHSLQVSPFSLQLLVPLLAMMM